MREFFPDIYCEYLVKLLKEKLTVLQVTPLPLEFLTIKVVHTEPLATCKLQVRFFYPAPDDFLSCISA